MPQFIRWYDNALAPAVCHDIIERFEQDDRHHGRHGFGQSRGPKST